MSTLAVQVRNYTPFIHDGHGATHASVHLLLENGDNAHVSFRRDGHQLGSNQEVQLGTVTHYNVWYRQDAYSDIMDLLRNEKPIWFFWRQDPRGEFHAALGASDEPPGEEES